MWHVDMRNDVVKVRLDIYEKNLENQIKSKLRTRVANLK